MDETEIAAKGRYLDKVTKRMKQEKPTQAQIKEFWEWCGILYAGDGRWMYPDGLIHWQGVDNLDLNSLFKYAVPVAIIKLESRFDELTNKIRGLELLFLKWVEKIREGYSLEDGLFWAIWEVIHGH